MAKGGWTKVDTVMKYAEKYFILIGEFKDEVQL